jgi:integrase
VTKLDLPYIHRVRRGARTYHYFRKPGFPPTRIPGTPGTREFGDVYQALLKQEKPPIGAARNVPGSVGALVAAWKLSPGYVRLKPRSKRTYGRLLDAWAKGKEDRPVAMLEPRHIIGFRDALGSTPAQANATLNVLRQILQFAFERGWRRDNPCRDVKRIRYGKKPHATWTEEDIEAFEAKHPLGSRARTALALLLYLGQRSGDTIRMGPQHVRDGSVHVVQEKTGKALAVPMHQDLRDALAAHPGGHLAFLVTYTGAPFASQTAFANWFRDCTRAAGLDLPVHGLRKATCCRLAEAGCTPHQIAAITGQSMKIVELYTRDVSQRRLAESAVTRLGRPSKHQT